MAQLRNDYSEFKKRNTEIVILGPENSESFARYWTKNNLNFTGIPDPEHKVLKLYGQEIKIFKFGRMPAQLLIDKSSNVRFVHYGHNMSDIPLNSEMLELIDSL